MRALALFCLLFLTAPAQEGTASLTGNVEDFTGAIIPGALAELRLVNEPYTVAEATTDDAGVYRFRGLAHGEYTLKLGEAGFATLTVKGVDVSNGEQKKLGDLTLAVSAMDCHVRGMVDFLRLLPGEGKTGGISSALRTEKGPIADATLTLLCGAAVCGETKTGAGGEFEFANLSPGEFTIRVNHPGFYPLDVPEFAAQTGTEATYYPILIERCPHENCDPRRRKKKLVLCE